MIIGILGAAGSGKDTLARNIIDAAAISSIEIQRYGFADPIKSACSELFGWDDRHTFGELKEDVDPYFGFSPRHAYQTMGTEWGRNLLSQDVWLKIAGRKAESTHLIIPDVRFENELDFVHKKNGIIIRIVRPNQKTIPENSHVSENALKGNVLDRYPIIEFENTTMDKMVEFSYKIARQIIDELRDESAPGTHATND